jgi:hypothetical protein
MDSMLVAATVNKHAAAKIIKVRESIAVELSSSSSSSWW